MLLELNIFFIEKNTYLNYFIIQSIFLITHQYFNIVNIVNPLFMVKLNIFHIYITINWINNAILF